MITWKLWRALRFPDEDHPLFQRLQRQPIDLPGKRLFRPVYENRVFKLLWSVIAALLPVILVLIAPGALLLAANGFGALVAFNIMSTINRERQQGTYDLLALTPMGLGASNWLIAVAWTQRLAAVDRLGGVRILTIILLTIVLFSSLGSENLTPITVLALLVALNLDAIQTIISGCLCGMLAQELGESGSPFAAVTIFAFVQIIAVYLPTTGAAIFLYEMLHPLGWERWLVESAVGLVTATLLFLLHELVIRLVWRALERRLL